MKTANWFLLAILLFVGKTTLLAADASFNVAAHDKSLQRYRAMLKTDKKNEQARQGLAEITIAFVLQAEQQLSRAQPAEPRRLLTRVEKELPDTLWRLNNMASQADHRAQLTVGLLHKFGILTKKDSTKACEYFLKAKGQGIAAADYHAALCLTKSDPDLSLTLISAAAEAGHAGRILRAVRGWEQPSDHAPVFASFDL